MYLTLETLPSLSGLRKVGIVNCKFTNVHPGQFGTILGRLDAWFSFGGPGNGQDRQIWISQKFEKSTYLILK